MYDSLKLVFRSGVSVFEAVTLEGRSLQVERNVKVHVLGFL